MSPGGECALAPTRSVGDVEFGQTVVIADPECTEVRLGPQHKYIVCASDGLWEFLDGQTVVSQFFNSGNVSAAALDLVRFSQAEWFKTCGGYCDDISVVAVELPVAAWKDGVAEFEQASGVQTAHKTAKQEVVMCHKLAGIQR
eukprot:TRINITY_DN4038_c0_g1_i2.p2 TRINITY_DN4038_c0_g1~~TRINITY_DN4038_c0_g1_i2.p2  ORF type:complete len:143 (-),score=37.72 TRINITY_DN4038_c0_g1_i2:182-610(-)